MMKGPPFERYPGPPRRHGASFRVISPWRDALAWVSIAGPLAVIRYLVREDGGWREALAEAPAGRDPEESLWALDRRDPVELVFRAIPEIAVNAVAYVGVTRDACEIRVEGATSSTRVRELIAVPAGTTIMDGEGAVLVRIPAA